MNTAMQEPLLMTVDEVAEALGLSRRMVYEHAARKSFPDGVVVRLGRSVYFSRPKMEVWLKGEKEESKEKKKRSFWPPI